MAAPSPVVEMNHASLRVPIEGGWSRRSGSWTPLAARFWWPEPPVEVADLRSYMPQAREYLDRDTVWAFNLMANLATALVLSRTWASTSEPANNTSPLAMLWCEGGLNALVEDAFALPEARLSLQPWPMISTMRTLSQVADEVSVRIDAWHGALGLAVGPDAAHRLAQDRDLAILVAQWASKCLDTVSDWEAGIVQTDDDD